MFRIKKTVLQLVLLVVGVAMLSFGALRGEADTVLAKAIRLCLECVGIG
ncbi:MAG: CD1871A family CXXC motif-containing protein [Lachnospiraceae bacterium]|nr:CD1871A family CXXC motif-containing protein [Lachnospiraceae bacterium]